MSRAIPTQAELGRRAALSKAWERRDYWSERWMHAGRFGLDAAATDDARNEFFRAEREIAVLGWSATL